MICKRDRVEEDMVDDWIYLNLTVVIRIQGCGSGSSGDDGRWRNLVLLINDLTSSSRPREG